MSFVFVGIRLIIQMVTNAHLIITALMAQSDTSNFPM